MRRILPIVLLLTAFLINAQTTIFVEDWDGNGPGIGEWTLYNLDNRTPVGPGGTDGEALSFLVQDAWTVLSFEQIQGANPLFEAYPTAATGMDGNIIASNSWYNPVGIANDWLVSPLITIPAGATNISLNWAATSLGNATFLEDYRVHLSPTGGSQVANFTNLLIDVNNELNTGNFRTQVLNDNLAGTSIRFAFQNDGNDQYVMFLDNITLTATLTASTNDFFASNLKIYPNPTNGMINLSSSTTLINTVSVTDLNGRIVKFFNLSGISQTELNVSELTSGMYFVSVETDLGKGTTKIVKN
ncbi:T9SS type A sorting domain-containing protein [Flavobacterium sp.]|uniref:T9SS type A sorting domain-containing protein n=1 Tax=Flavobacterium sp. TaxID=239 RepID=UPI003527EAA8